MLEARLQLGTESLSAARLILDPADTLQLQPTMLGVRSRVDIRLAGPGREEDRSKI